MWIPFKSSPSYHPNSRSYKTVEVSFSFFFIFFFWCCCCCCCLEWEHKWMHMYIYTCSFFFSRQNERKEKRESVRRWHFFCCMILIIPYSILPFPSFLEAEQKRKNTSLSA
jgi:hypothetical protein